jgi:hypothetical protein
MEGITHIPKRCPNYFLKLLSFDFIDCLMEKYSICNNLGHYQSKHYEITLMHSYSLMAFKWYQKCKESQYVLKNINKTKKINCFDIMIWGCHELCFFLGKNNHFDLKLKILHIQNCFLKKWPYFIIFPYIYIYIYYFFFSR